jgi:hypothetical protein
VDGTGIPALLLLTAASLLSAIVAISVPGIAVRTCIRRVFVVVMNLSPWTSGISLKEFSTLETFLAAWFLSFIIFGMAFLALAPYMLSAFRPH